MVKISNNENTEYFPIPKIITISSIVESDSEIFKEAEEQFIREITHENYVKITGMELL